MSTVKANDLTNVTGGIPTVKSQQLIPTAWINFNGTGAIAIRDSEGFSSITDHGTGAYRVNFTNSMPNDNYAAVTSGGAEVSWNGTGTHISGANTTYVQVYHVEANSATDLTRANLVVLGGQ